MNVKIREWKLEDAQSLAEALSNKNVLNNLRDGLPYPYTEKDAADYIIAMLHSDPGSTFAYAVDMDGTAIGSIGAFRQANIHFRTAELGYYLDEAYWGKERAVSRCYKQKVRHRFSASLFSQTVFHTAFLPPGS